MKYTYTYEEAIKLIKQKIAALKKPTKPKKVVADTSIKKTTKNKKILHGDIADFCKANGLDYFTVVNCLNSKSETHPILVKNLLEILLDTKHIKHKKLNIYFIEKI